MDIDCQAIVPGTPHTCVAETKAKHFRTDYSCNNIYNLSLDQALTPKF